MIRLRWDGWGAASFGLNNAGRVYFVYLGPLTLMVVMGLNRIGM